MIDVNEGRKNMYLLQGIFVFIVGAVLLSVGLSSMIIVSVFGILVLVLAVLLFAATNGLQIDTELNRYRQYAKIGWFYSGGWTSFGLVESAQLVLTSENMFKPGMATQSRGSSMSTTIVRTYDIEFVLKSAKVITIFEFDTYKDAKHALKKINEELDVPVANKVAEKMAKNKRSRR